MNTLNSPISVGGKLARKKSAWGHIDFLVKVDLMWVQDPRSSPKPSSRFPTNTLNTSYRIEIAQNKIITHTHFLEKESMQPTLIL